MQGFYAEKSIYWKITATLLDEVLQYDFSCCWLQFQWELYETLELEFTWKQQMLQNPSLNADALVKIVPKSPQNDPFWMQAASPFRYPQGLGNGSIWRLPQRKVGRYCLSPTSLQRVVAWWSIALTLLLSRQSSPLWELHPLKGLQAGSGQKNSACA